MVGLSEPLAQRPASDVRAIRPTTTLTGNQAGLWTNPEPHLEPSLAFGA